MIGPKNDVSSSWSTQRRPSSHSNGITFSIDHAQRASGVERYPLDRGRVEVGLREDSPRTRADGSPDVFAGLFKDPVIIRVAVGGGFLCNRDGFVSKYVVAVEPRDSGLTIAPCNAPTAFAMIVPWASRITPRAEPVPLCIDRSSRSVQSSIITVKVYLTRRNRCNSYGLISLRSDGIGRAI